LALFFVITRLEGQFLENSYLIVYGKALIYRIMGIALLLI